MNDALIVLVGLGLIGVGFWAGQVYGMRRQFVQSAEKFAKMQAKLIEVTRATVNELQEDLRDVWALRPDHIPLKGGRQGAHAWRNIAKIMERRGITLDDPEYDGSEVSNGKA